jgi:hypothetical protein
VCLDEERWREAPARQEHDLEEIRRLFARYRLAVSLARAADEDRLAPDPEPERTPAGTPA